MKHNTTLLIVLIFSAILLVASCVTTPLPPPPPGQRPEPSFMEELEGTGRANPGEVRFIDDFPMPELGTVRDIWVYTPPGYYETDKFYPVIYMHDGQNLFYRDLAYSGEWMVDETIDGLVAKGLFDGAIVVGIANGGERRVSEYSPYAASFNGMETTAIPYLIDVVMSVKPWAEREFRILPGAENSSLAGSSLGGLISLYSVLIFAGEFESIIAMSPSIWVDDRAILRDYQQSPSAISGLRFYLDMGSGEGGENVENTREMADLLSAYGVTDLQLVIDPGAGHNEAAWRDRFPHVLAWLYGFELE